MHYIEIMLLSTQRAQILLYLHMSLRWNLRYIALLLGQDPDVVSVLRCHPT